MRVRFNVHDRAAYPNGVELEFSPELLTDRQRALVEECCAGEPVCRLAPKIPGTTINGTNVWLTEPTVDGLRVELDRVIASLDALAAKKRR